MSPRSRPTLALALATAFAGTAAPAPAGADDPVPLVERCYVEGLTDAQVAAGEESDVWCVEVPEDEPLARRGTSVLVELYDSADGSGTPLILEGTTCTGLNVNWGPAHPWNDKVSSTDLVVCGHAKHYQGSSFTGTNQLYSGIGFHAVSGAMNNTTSSIEYA